MYKKTISFLMFIFFLQNNFCCLAQNMNASKKYCRNKITVSEAIKKAEDNPRDNNVFIELLKVYPSTWDDFKDVYFPEETDISKELEHHLYILQRSRNNGLAEEYYNKLINLFLDADNSKKTHNLKETIETFIEIETLGSIYVYPDNEDTILSVLYKRPRADQFEFWRIAFKDEVFLGGISGFEDRIKARFPDMMEMLNDGRKYYEPRKIEEVVVQ